MLPGFRQEVAQLRALLSGETDPARRADAASRLGQQLAELGDADGALALLADARHWFEQRQDAPRLAGIDHAIGLACAARGEHGRARELLEQTLDGARVRGDALAEALLEASLAKILTATGEIARAAELYEAARRYFETHWHPAELARCLTGLAQLAAEAGRHTE